MWLWALLPVSIAVLGSGGIWTVFAMAVTNGSVNLTEGFPYISKCGSYPPQSCLFSQVCSTCSFLAFWMMAIRFQQVKDFSNHGKANTASIVLGFISATGTCILGNFQQSVLKYVHILGAFMAFYMGLAYFWTQLYLTYQTQPSHDRRWVGPVRASCCTFCTILVITMPILQKVGFPSEAAVCEWVVVMLFFCLFALGAAEFRHVDCHHFTVQKRALNIQSGHVSIHTNIRVANTLT
ncbi:modulator of macroautophagy TMEM150B [Cynoglossus semilaevis]|uniref:Transmembrane protein 150B n=1 Tax=Cynoglossus semilaevis TaxID=244447 RepID=A0A3P8V998_CYNSE|nr:modulator of macroautophagy TMEM150B [Cynoglossus semilaevis]